MGKIMIIAGFDQSLVLFRRELIEGWLQAGLNVVAAAPGRTVEKDLQQMGVSYREIPLERTGLNPLKDLRLLLNLVGLINRERPQALFLYTIKPVIYGSLAAALGWRQARVYVMITGLGYAFIEGAGSGLLKRLVIFLYRLALGNCEKVFFQNPDDLALFKGLKIVKPEKTVRVNGSGVNTAYFEFKPLPAGNAVFLIIARLLKEKGILEFVEAARQVKERYPETVFRLIGWDLGSSPSALGRDDLDKWQNEGLIEVYGETEDVRPYLAESHVYVLPSYREGTPRTVLEAMATGRAVITTDVPGCRETVVDGLNGFLVPVRDSKALAAAMERFVTEPGLAEQMGRQSRKIAVGKYDVRKVNRVINETMGLL